MMKTTATALYIHVLIALGAASLAAWGTWNVQEWRLGKQIAEVESRHAQAMQEQERKAREATQAARAEEQRRTAEVQKVADEAHQNLARARADATAAADAGRRLRQQIATLTASCRGATSDPSAAPTGPSADATADLLADVQRRLGEATEGIAGFADHAHAAGRACERIHDGLIR